MLVLSIIAAILTYPLWMWIHERAHVYALEKFHILLSYKIYLYPHREKGVFYWARVRYAMLRLPTKWEQCVISLAPRIPDVCAAILAPICIGLGLWPLAILFYGGVIDLITGSFGITPESDLQKAVATGYVNSISIRAYGFLIAVVSILGGIIAL